MIISLDEGGWPSHGHGSGDTWWLTMDVTEFRQYFPSDPVEFLVGFFKNSIMTSHGR